MECFMKLVVTHAQGSCQSLLYLSKFTVCATQASTAFSCSLKERLGVSPLSLELCPMYLGRLCWRLFVEHPGLKLMNQLKMTSVLTTFIFPWTLPNLSGNPRLGFASQSS